MKSTIVTMSSLLAAGVVGLPHYSNYTVVFDVPDTVTSRMAATITRTVKASYSAETVTSTVSPTSTATETIFSYVTSSSTTEEPSTVAMIATRVKAFAKPETTAVFATMARDDADAATTTFMVDPTTTTTTDPSPSCTETSFTINFNEEMLQQLDAPLYFQGIAFGHDFNLTSTDDSPFFHSEGDETVLMYRPSNEKDMDAQMWAGEDLGTFDLNGMDIGCVNLDGDKDCDLTVEGFFDGQTDTVKYHDEHITACKKDMDCNDKPLMHIDTPGFNNVNRVAFHVKDNKKAMRFFVDNLQISTGSQC